MIEIDVFSPQACPGGMLRIQHSEGKILIGLIVGKDLTNGGPLETLTIAKLIKNKVLLHQFLNLMFNLHYTCLSS